MFEKDFDMKQLISNRLLEIENLEERKIASNLLFEVFDQLCEYTQKEYSKLEDRIMAETNASIGDDTIVTGIMEQNQYDVTQDGLFPMCPEDLLDHTISADEMRAVLQDKGMYQIQTVLIEGDYTVINRILQFQHRFQAVIYTDEGEYQAKAILKPNFEYKNRIKELYEVFLLNGMEWNPVCIPYLYKLFDIYLCEAQIPEGIQIERVSFDFEDYEEYIRYHMLPVWNLESIQVTADIRPEPCEDKIHYIHYINNRRLNQEENYLVADRDDTVLNVLHHDKLAIVTLTKEARRWNLFRISGGIPSQSNYPLFHNRRENDRNANSRTTGGVFRFVSRLGYSQLLKLTRISFPSELNGQPQTYPMDDFMNYDVWTGASGQIMLLQFECMDKNNLYVNDIMSYLITAVQYEYREFHCVAEYE